MVVVVVVDEQWLVVGVVSSRPSLLLASNLLVPVFSVLLVMLFNSFLFCGVLRKYSLIVNGNFFAHISETAIRNFHCVAIK